MSKTRTTKANKSAPVTVRLPMYRVLRALAAKAGKNPTRTRAEIATKAGFSAISGTLTVALNGRKLPEGGRYVGLIEAGLIEVVPVELDGGVTETRYRITGAGVRAAKAFAADRKAGAVRDAAACTNARYQIS